MPQSDMTEKGGSDRLYRQWALLQKIPVRPAYKTVKQLVDELQDEGFTVSKRTVERDLNELKNGSFAVYSDEKGIGNNPNRWFFERDSKVHILPAMSMQMAFTLLFTQRILSSMLPPSVLKPMRTIFRKAETTLKSNRKNSYRHWEKFVKHVPRTLPLLSAQVDQGILENCLEATLQGCQLNVVYKPRYDDQVEYRVNPLGLVYRDGVIYLVCTLWEYTDIKQLALHRMLPVELIPDSKAFKPAGFDLESYIEKSGAFLYERSPGKTVKVVLKFEKYSAHHLEETPLSQDQVIQHRDDYAIVKATLLDTNQLRWWLLGFGDNVEVIKPKKIREEFKSIAENMARSYS